MGTSSLAQKIRYRLSQILLYYLFRNPCDTSFIFFGKIVVVVINIKQLDGSVSSFAGE